MNITGRTLVHNFKKTMPECYVRMFPVNWESIIPAVTFKLMGVASSFSPFCRISIIISINLALVVAFHFEYFEYILV